MSQTPSTDLGARVTQLERGLALALERIAALEGHPASPTAPVVAETTAVPRAAARDRVALVTLLGRSCIVAGGAFLIRALTEAAVWPGTVGVAIGLLYALVWLVAADRTAAAHPLSARVHGATAVGIGWPLVAEATLRFGLLNAAGAALVLAVLVAGVFVVAARRRLADVAGLAGTGTVAVGLMIAIATGEHGVVSLLLITLASATYWLSGSRSYTWLRWLTAVAAGLSTLAVTTRALASPPREPAWIAVLSLAWLAATVQASLATRFILLSREARLFDVLQIGSVLIIGGGGAIALTQSGGAGRSLVGIVMLVFGLGASLAGQARLVDRSHLVTAYHTVMTFGLAATLAALAVLCDGGAIAVICAAVAVTLRFGESWRVPPAPPIHGLVYALAALLASGLPASAWTAWVRGPVGAPNVAPVTIVTLIVAVWWAGRRLPVAVTAESAVTRVAQVIVAGAVAFTLGGVLASLLSLAVAGAGADAGIVASIRTIVVSVMAIGVAAIGRVSPHAGFRRLVYPILGAGGLRMLADDLRHSEPSTLFLALAAFGVALVVAPRLTARAAASGSSPQA